MPPIEEGYKKNFETLMRAASDSRLCLVDCQDKATGKPVRVIAAVSNVEGSEELDIVPLAKMFDGNPYDELNPPNAEGGYHGKR